MEKNASKYPRIHDKIEAEEARFIIETAKKYYPEGYTDVSTKNKKIAEEVNSAYHRNRTKSDIRSLLMHVKHCKLTLEDFEE